MQNAADSIIAFQTPFVMKAGPMVMHSDKAMAAGGNGVRVAALVGSKSAADGASHLAQGRIHEANDAMKTFENQ